MNIFLVYTLLITIKIHKTRPCCPIYTLRPTFGASGLLAGWSSAWPGRAKLNPRYSRFCGYCSAPAVSYSSCIVYMEEEKEEEIEEETHLVLRMNEDALRVEYIKYHT